MSADFTVRLFELDKDGALEPILGTNESYFAGTVPTVGDTYSKYVEVEDRWISYNVQRRIFINSSDGASGWFIMVRKLDDTPLLNHAVEAWIEDTRFWREAEEQDAFEEHEIAAQTKGTFEYWKRQQEEREKYRPIHKLNGPQARALRFLSDHPEIHTVDLIPQCGDKTMEVLEKAKCVRPGGKDYRGLREWFITDEGHAELKRIETYRNWNRE